MDDRDPIPFVEGIEVVPSDEADDIRRVVQALRTLLGRNREQTGHYQADVHVKSHGCATGELRVLPHLPSELAQGLFQHERVFPIRARFSNSAPQSQPDLIPDGRGLAIQVLDVPGEQLVATGLAAATQDFVMVNHPVFLARNVKDYLRLEQVLVKGNDNPLKTAVLGLTGDAWNPLQWHWREALSVVQIAGHLPAHPASHTYYSMAPIRFGQFVAKYRVRPAGEIPGTGVELAYNLGTRPDALRQMLEETLRAQPLQFEFQIQLRTSATSMPVEDATVEWPENESPYRPVAVLSFPRQEIGAQQQNASCRQLAFNVWHALTDHRPLGGINRLRREIYPISADWRRQEIHAP